jgi:hypothetical protein
MVENDRMDVKHSIETYLGNRKNETSQRPFSVKILRSRLRSCLDRNVGTGCDCRRLLQKAGIATRLVGEARLVKEVLKRKDGCRPVRIAKMSEIESTLFMPAPAPQSTSLELAHHAINIHSQLFGLHNIVQNPFPRRPGCFSSLGLIKAIESPQLSLRLKEERHLQDLVQAGLALVFKDVVAPLALFFPGVFACFFAWVVAFTSLLEVA